jgi:hypothetical protein
MRFSEYYRGVVRDGRPGRPTAREARQDFRRDFEARIDALQVR